jgi:DNA-directed RNA polymerase subunit beta
VSLLEQLSDYAVCPRQRRTFSKLEKILEVPNLIDIQKKSYEWFLSEGVKETVADISPIEDYTGSLAVEFGTHHFEEPTSTIEECRDKDGNYSAPLFMDVSFVNKETGEIRQQSVFMGDFPMMTEWGTFIINGTERVVVTQLVRSPGAYVMEPKDPAKQVFVANLMPSRGSWLELEIDKKGLVNVRIDRKRKLPVTVLLRALGYATNEEIVKIFGDSVYMKHTLEKDSTASQEEALIELFKKQRPGEPPSLDSARSLLRALFFDPKRYDLTKVGRYKLNSRLNLNVDPETRTLTNDDIIALIKALIMLPDKLGIPEDATDYAEEARSLMQQNLEAIAHDLDESASWCRKHSASASTAWSAW